MTSNKEVDMTYYKRLTIDKKLVNMEAFVADTYETKLKVEENFNSTNEQIQLVNEKVLFNKSQIQKQSMLVERNKRNIIE